MALSSHQSGALAWRDQRAALVKHWTRASSQPSYFNIAAIRDSLRRVQGAYDTIQSRLTVPRDSFSDDIIRGLLLAYRYMNDQIHNGREVSSPLLQQINHVIHYGWDSELRREYEKAINATEEKCAAYAPRLLTWHARHQKDPWKRTAGTYIRILEPPQLYTDGNHRSGAIVASSILIRARLPPFVLTVDNAVEYFNLSADIKYGLDLSSYFRRVVEGDWKPARWKMPSFFRDSAQSVFVTSDYGQDRVPEQGPFDADTFFMCEERALLKRASIQR